MTQPIFNVTTVRREAIPSTMNGAPFVVFRTIGRVLDTELILHETYLLMRNLEHAQAVAWAFNHGETAPNPLT